MAPSQESPSSTKISRDVVLIISVLLFTAFVMLLNETTLSVALPAIMESFDITAATAQWLLTGFMLTMAIVMPTTGWLLERFATRTVFLTAVVFFLVGTVIAAISPTFLVMVVARVLQAVGTAIVMPLLMTVAMTLVPAGRRGTVMGLISVVMAVGPALGPTVAGFILSFADWHMIFWVMVPLVGISGIVGAIFLRDVGERRTVPLDVLSVLLSAVAFGGLIYALSSIGIIMEGGTAATIALVLLAVGLVALGLFVWRQLSLGKKDKALLDLRPLSVRNFTLAIIPLLILFMSLLGVVNTLPLYLQGALLATALVSGLVVMPGGLVEAVVSPIAGTLFDRFGVRPLAIPGMVIVVVSFFALSRVDDTTDPWTVMWIYVVFSIGLGMAMTPLMTTALGALPKNLYSHGSAILNTLQQLAGAAGTAILIAIYSAVSESQMADGVGAEIAIADGANSAFLVGAWLAVIGLVFTVFVSTGSPKKTEVTTVVTEEPKSNK